MTEPKEAGNTQELVLEDLQADLKTKLGDGELLQIRDEYFYHTNEGTMYSVDFDISNQKKTEDECPLKKKQKEKNIQETNDMTVKEGIKGKAGEQSKEDDMDAEMSDDNKKEISKTDPADKSDAETPKKPKQMDLAPPPAPVIDEKAIAEMVSKMARDMVEKELKARDDSKKEEDLKTVLQTEKYGLKADMLEGKTRKELELAKTLIEMSKPFQDFQAQKAKEAELEKPPEINKEIFEDFTKIRKGNDLWAEARKIMGGGS